MHLGYSFASAVSLIGYDSFCLPRSWLKEKVALTRFHLSVWPSGRLIWDRVKSVQEPKLRLGKPLSTVLLYDILHALQDCSLLQKTS